MMCMKDMLCEAKDKITESKDIVFNRTIDVKMALAKKGHLDQPIKAVSIHRCCSTPLWKILTVTVAIMLGTVALCKMIKCIGCRDQEE